MKDRIFEGTFFITEDNKLNFHCKTKNVSFEDVKNGLIMLRNEVDRQLENEKQCPYFKIGEIK